MSVWDGVVVSPLDKACEKQQTEKKEGEGEDFDDEMEGENLDEPMETQQN